MLSDTKSSVQHRPLRHFQPSGNFVSHSEFHWGIHNTLHCNATQVWSWSFHALAWQILLLWILSWSGTAPSSPSQTNIDPENYLQNLELPLPSFKHNAASPNTIPLRKRIKKVFFSRLNLTSSGVYKVTNLMNKSRKVQSNECVYSHRSDILGQEVWKRPDMF